MKRQYFNISILAKPEDSIDKSLLQTRDWLRERDGSPDLRVLRRAGHYRRSQTCSRASAAEARSLSSRTSRRKRRSLAASEMDWSMPSVQWR